MKVGVIWENCAKAKENLGLGRILGEHASRASQYDAVYITNCVTLF